MTLLTDPFATYKLLAYELQRRDYIVSEYYEDERLAVTYTSPSGKVWETYGALIQYPFTDDSTRRLLVDKTAAYDYVASKGVAVPFTRAVEYDESLNLGELDSILSAYAPLIVKPNDSSLSRGLTLDINDTEALRTAIDYARTINKSTVLIQNQVSGEEVRIAVIDGKVKAALLRQTPRVIGDGVSSVKELLVRENTIREELVFSYISYPQLTDDIIDEHFFEDTRVPVDGEVVELSRSTMIRNGCSVYEILDKVHPSYVEAVEKLATDIESKFFVADILINNHSLPLAPSNYWFLEFNTSPVLKLFYGCRDGKMFDIIPQLADIIDSQLA